MRQRSWQVVLAGSLAALLFITAGITGWRLVATLFGGASAMHATGRATLSTAGPTRTRSPAPVGVAHPWISLSSFQAGFSVLVYANDASAANTFSPVLDRLAEDNVNCISLVFPLYTANLNSDQVGAGPGTPSDQLLIDLIRMARQRGFAVMLRPLLDEASLKPSWRGGLEPADPTAWFGSYDQEILHYAELGQRQGVQAIDVGTEFNSLEKYVVAWQQLIAQVRRAFSGLVTYSFNWGVQWETGFWRDLDYASIDAYFPLDHTPFQATVEEMATDWQRWIQVIEQADAGIGTPIVFSELGVPPQTGDHLHPWAYGPSGQLDPAEQSDYYQAACQALPGHIAGIYWWSGTIALPADPSQDSSYNPLGKPAELVMRSSYAGLAGVVPAAAGGDPGHP